MTTSFYETLDGVQLTERRRIEEAYARRPHRSRYSFSEPDYVLMVEERERRLQRILQNRGHRTLEDIMILDVGCGTGRWLHTFLRWGARPENLYGVDFLPDRIAQARGSCPAGVTLKCQDATCLEFEDSAFDLVLQSTVFTSILNLERKQQLAREMVRVLRPGGIVVWYDFYLNNPRNPDVKGVGKRELRQLFPGCGIVLTRLTLAPPLGRRVAPISRSLYRALSCFSLLRTHYLGIISRP